MDHLKGSSIQRTAAVIMLIVGIALMGYFVIWCTGILRWSFNIGLLFILISSVLLLNQSIMLFLNKHYLLLKRFGILRKVVFVTFISFLIVFISIEGLVIHSSINSDEDIKAEYILIPGAEVIKDRPSRVMLNRLKKSLSYIRNNPGAKIIVSGGKSSEDVYSEAEVMKRYLVNYGVEENRIFKEEQSINSYQNIYNTIKIIDSIGSLEDYKIMIVTSDYHTFRCKMIAKSFEIDAYSINVPTHYSVVPICFMTEFFSVIKAVSQIM